MAAYDTILFDFDGVLVDTEPLHFECWRTIVENWGISITWDRFRKCCRGLSGRELVEQLCCICEPKLAFDKLWTAYPIKKQLYLQRIHMGFHVESELTLFLVTLARRKNLAVVTSSPRHEVERILQTAQILPCFTLLVCAEDVSSHKPHPDPYRAAAQKFGAKKVLVVEDSTVGRDSGLAAGFDVILVNSPAEVPRKVSCRLKRYERIGFST